MSVETVAAETWLYGVLHGDATLSALVAGQVYAYVAPERATFPFVVFSAQGGSDVRGVGPARIGASLLYSVRGVMTGRSFAPLQPIAARLDTLLHAQSGGTVLACVREQPYSLAEADGGQEYRHLGGIYRLFVQ